MTGNPLNADDMVGNSIKHVIYEFPQLRCCATSVPQPICPILVYLLHYGIAVTVDSSSAFAPRRSLRNGSKLRSVARLNDRLKGSTVRDGLASPSMRFPSRHGQVF